MSDIFNLLDGADFEALNVCKTPDGWQASLKRERGNSYSIRVQATPAQAIAAVLDAPVPLPLPPPPY